MMCFERAQFMPEPGHIPIKQPWTFGAVLWLGNSMAWTNCAGLPM